MNKQSKQELVVQMHDRLTRAKAVFLADFRGMSVGQATNLRNELRSASVEYKVFKNTLLDLAAEGTDVECIRPHLAGPTAIAISYDDPVSAAKVLNKFAKDPTGKFVLKAGVLSGKLLDLKQIQALADLPSREVLIGKMLGSMQAPATNFVGVLAALPGSLVRVLDAIRVQKTTH
ncbi:50S ribosomal protein L10 [Pelotalea chapellei]|uniref:Large ribosomal subunit protein uL10 n=1 Tax=Pelotalea chapellei TaxID=44671 RepID=A0ABS5UD04_9BACT|nr:50S ribosomal protein L10 [Pelotalea chapellei]MBT1073571.1 50S ribosomal protein L10 [Pelotalea chapellei]